MVKNKLCAILNLTEDDSALKPLTNTRPIAGLPFANRYRVVDFALSNICHAEINSVALFIAESGRSIYDHIRSGGSWDLDSPVSGGIFTFSQQNWKLRHHEENEHEDYYYNHRVFMSRSKAEYVFVAGSKIIANIDIKAVLRQHLNQAKDITVVYKPMQKEFLGRAMNKTRALILDDNYTLTGVRTYAELPDTDKINASLSMYLISVAKLNEIIDRAVEEGVYMEVDELIQHYLLDYAVNTYEYTGYTANIDSIDRYYRANMDMLDRAKFTALLQSSLPILTKTKNGVPTYYGEQAQVSETLVGTGAFIEGNVHHSLISRKVKIAEGADVSDSIILQGVEIGAGAKVAYAIIDKDSVVAPGATVIGSPDNIIVIGKNSYIEA
ncbi:MAG: glucose-1-phosphate adenylyltransferase subunit GlgD [Aerococcaceae bacterium]|nr:glucose-1-phosphate adenylyltransferase subunit GlgD [Aerococcaceae bacterium]